MAIAPPAARRPSVSASRAGRRSAFRSGSGSADDHAARRSDDDAVVVHRLADAPPAGATDGDRRRRGAARRRPRRPGPRRPTPGWPSLVSVRLSRRDTAPASRRAPSTPSGAAASTAAAPTSADERGVEPGDLRGRRAERLHDPDLADLPREHGGERGGDEDGGEDERHRREREQHDEDGDHLPLVRVLAGRRDADLADRVAALAEPARHVRRAGLDLRRASRARPRRRCGARRARAAPRGARAWRA